jgi:hypothetical protein
MVRLRILIVLALAALAAGCNTPPPAPAIIAQNYVNAVAEANYPGACGMLDAHALRALTTATKSNAGCGSLLARCYPTNAAVLKRDEAQLFYTNTVTTFEGDRASVATSGTAVANRVRELAFVKRNDTWFLDSYGRVRCVAPKRKRHHRAKR